MPRGHEHDLIYSHQYLRALFGPIFRQVFLEKDCNLMGKKDRCARLVGCIIMIAYFPEKYTVKFSFCPKSTRKC